VLAGVPGGELECPRCGSLKPAEQTGYLPLYREVDGKPCCVLVHEYTRDAVDSLRFHRRVRIGRGSGVTDGVWVREDPVQKPAYQTTVPHRMRPADVTPTVLVLWAIPELIAWYNLTEKNPTGPVSYTPLKQEALPVEPEARPVAVDDDPRAVADRDAIKAIMARRREVVEPSANGKHKPNG